ncbi:MAG: hypothetical protein ACREXT_03145 [Gammaproteobacteria bacterium]
MLSIVTVSHLLEYLELAGGHAVEITEINNYLQQYGASPHRIEGAN